MVSAHSVRQQLRRIGADYHFWGVPELRELPKILFDNEQIKHVVYGRYDGGFATLCATDIRVLLIDKKPLFLTLEDIRYDMVSDVMFNHRLINASLILGTVHNSIRFMGFNKDKLRQMTNFIQQRVMEFRRHQQVNVEQEAQPEFGQFQHTVSTQPVASYTYQPMATVSGVSGAIGQISTQQAINPYRMPIMIRRRASRFYNPR